MATVKILIAGYASADSGGHSCSTIVLVRDGGLNIMVDPGTVADPQILIDALKKEGLSPADIDIVYLTHSHLDHFRWIGLFAKAKVLDYWGWWIGDVSEDYEGKVTENIEMIKTPGHSVDGTTLLVKTQEGVVAICGDVFWKENFPPTDPYASDIVKLAESRQLVLGAADYVIPGHGPMFKAR
jgi:glyoxylase-like metal-dependent hydrolase (beta-lactamase superfamily II)